MYMKCYFGKGIRDGLDDAENRPVRWVCGDIIVTINFECMDRRLCTLQENAHLKFTILKQIYQNRFFAY